jgi:hypothetical protein
VKKLLVVAMAAGLFVGGAGLAQAASQPHEPQDHGLCTAYYNGNKNGWEKKGTPPPPFQDLISRADDGDPNTTNDLATYCDGLVGGNPAPQGNSAGKGNGGN